MSQNHLPVTECCSVSYISHSNRCLWLYDFMLKHASHASFGGVDWIKFDGRTDTFSSSTWPTTALKQQQLLSYGLLIKRGVKEMQHKEQHFQESCTLWNATLTQSVFVGTCLRMCTHALTRAHRVLCRRWWIVAGEAVVIEFHFSGSAVSWRAKFERVCSLLCQPRCWSLWFSDALIPTLIM